MRVACVLGPATLYALVVCWLTWPLAARVTTHLPDTWPTARMDPPAMAWALAHQSRAMLAPALDMADGGVCHPEPRSLYFVERGIGALPVFAPVFWATENPILALNAVFLVGVVATMTALHWVVHRWSGSHLAGAAAALTFVSPSWTLRTWLPVAPNYAQLQYMPFVLFLAATSRLDARRTAVLATLLALQGLASPYLAAAVAAPVGAVAGLGLVRGRSRRRSLGTLGALAIATLVWLVAFAGHAAVVHGDSDALARSVWSRSAAYPAPLPWGLVAADAATAIPAGLMLIIVVGGLLLVWRPPDERLRRRAWGHAVGWVVIGTAASLPPVVEWYGRAVELPHARLLEYVPALAILRFPGRLAASALVGMSVLVGLTVARIVETARPTRVGGMAIALVLVCLGHVGGPESQRRAMRVALSSAPYPLWRPTSLPRAAERLIAAHGGPILELPVGPVAAPLSVGDAPLGARAMLHAVAHRQRLVNCYPSYSPRGLEERMELARRLPDPVALATLRARTGLHTLVVRPGLYGAIEREVCATLPRARRPAACDRDLGAPARRAWLAIAERGGAAGLCLLGRTGDTLIFAADACATAGSP